MALLIISLFLAIVIFLLTVKLKEYVEEVQDLREQIKTTLFQLAKADKKPKKEGFLPILLFCVNIH